MIDLAASSPISQASASSSADWFRNAELRRVGTAATMIVVCGTVIILAVTMTVGHYNSLAHSGPKAVLDGAVISLMIGERGRWRCVALLGVVYGLVLLLQVGLFYLVPVMAVAGGLAAVTGRGLTRLGLRAAAIFIAAAMYEVLAGCGMPLKIYFGTDGHAGALLWGMWLAELPLRAVGACIGVGLARRWAARRDDPIAGTTAAAIASLNLNSLSGERYSDEAVSDMHMPPVQSANSSAANSGESEARHIAGHSSGARSVRPPHRGPAAIGLRIAASVIACVLPMMVSSWWALGAIALAYLVYALAAGLRGKLLAAAAGLLWSWLVFGLCSYLWNRDLALVLDMLRTLILRFTPLTLASTVLVTTTRPVELIRFLRTIAMPRMVIIPLSQVARSIPHARRLIRLNAYALRRPSRTKRFAPFVRLRAFTSLVLLPMIGMWSRELHGTDRPEVEGFTANESPGKAPS